MSAPPGAWSIARVAAFLPVVVISQHRICSGQVAIGLRGPCSIERIVTLHVRIRTHPLRHYLTGHLRRLHRIGLLREEVVHIGRCRYRTVRIRRIAAQTRDVLRLPGLIGDVDGARADRATRRRTLVAIGILRHHRHNAACAAD